MTADSPDPLDEMIAGAMRFERPLAVSGNVGSGWWTGTLAAGEQLVAAAWAEEIYLIRFDRGGNEPDIQRRPFERASEEDAFVADVERAVREVFPDFTPGVIRVKPFWVEEVELELHPLPDWARRFVDAGWPARRICRTERERR